ncbi:MAG: DUF5666 domain-containing protein [Terriglobales bacterium]
MTRPLVLSLAVLGSFLLTASASTAQSQAASPSASVATQPKAATQSKTQSPKDASPEIMDANDPLFGIPPLPKGKISLVGGTVQKIDRVRNRVTIKSFGDHPQTMKFGFDERTHIFRDGVETTERGIRQGDRAYVDTMLDGPKLFARNIRIVTNLTPSDARGQILSYDARSGIMTVRDDISNTPVTFHVTPQTTVKGSGSASDLAPGSLVAVLFSPDKARRGVAREISLLAVPGSRFTFAGKVRYLDLRSGTIAIENVTDNKTYELEFKPGIVGDNVTIGSDVTASAVFSGKGYKAESIKLNEMTKASD